MNWGFGGLWRFLTGVLVPDHDGNVLPHISGFRRYLNIPKQTPNGQVINYGLQISLDLFCVHNVQLKLMTPELLRFKICVRCVHPKKVKTKISRA